MKKKYLEGIGVLLIYLYALHIWSLPLVDNLYPFGDVDSSTHFTLSDYMVQNDRVTYYLPKYLNFSYGPEGDGKLWYPPQYHTSAAIVSKMSGGHRILSIFLFYIVGATIMLLGSYLLMRKAFGVLPALALEFILIFSVRDIQWYLWGQYPQVMSFGLIPLSVYLTYMLYESIEKKEGVWKCSTYSVLLGFSMAMQFFVHPQAMLMSGAAIGFLTLFWWIKTKKFPIHIKYVLVIGLCAAALIIPVYDFPFGGEFYTAENSVSPFHFEGKYLSTLFSWYGSKEIQGVPPWYYEFGSVHSKWIIPFVVVGIIFLLLRRNKKDLVYLSLLLAFYVGMHDQILGLNRYERFLQTEALVIYPLAIIGVLGIVSLLPLIKDAKKKVIAGSLVLLCVAMVFTTGAVAKSNLSNAYGGLLRITPEEYRAIEWMEENLPEDADVLLEGTLVYAKKKWIQALSFRHGIWTRDNEYAYLTDHILLDGSDAKYLPKDQADQFLAQLQALNEEIAQRGELLYNQDNILIYRVNQSG